ncbi:MAG: hypothetical protein Q9163_004275 [Psora crenata]
MLASQKASRSRGLSTSSLNAETVLTSSTKCPHILGMSRSHRAFSWGAKSKWGSPHVGKVYKGFYTRHTDADRRQNKKALIITLNSHLLNISRSRSSPGFRSASSWKPEDLKQSWSCKRQTEEEESDDWYSRWEKHKRKQYEEFVKRVEQDPYQALFGASNRWLGWLDSQVSNIKEPNASAPAVRAASSAADAEKTGQKAPVSKEATTETCTVATSKEASKKNLSSSTTRATIIEEIRYEIDPITLRKIPKRSVLKSSGQTKDELINIPVKTIKPCSATAGLDQPSQIPSSQAESYSNKTAPPFVQGRLAQEDFGSRGPSSSPMEQNTEQNTSSNDRCGVLRIESALDRHLRVSKNKILGATTVASKYQRKETRQDGLELLRVSDVKSSAGLEGRQVTETDTGKQIRQRALEEQYERRSSKLEDRLAQEIANNSKTKYYKKVPSPNVVSDADVPASDSPIWINKQSSGIASPTTSPILTSGQVGKIRAKLVPLKTKIDSLKEDYAALRQQLLEEKRRVEESAKKKADKRARELLDQEIQAQKDAMQAIEMRQCRKPDIEEPASAVAHEELHGEGDMASNVHEFAGRARWYKRKAPHAQFEMDGKLQRLAKEKAFVRKIRDIYEDSYGTIDINHRQPLSIEDGAEHTCAMTENPSSPSVQDARLLNLVSSEDQGAYKYTRPDASWLLPIEKELSMELRSLQFAIDDCMHRASGELDKQKLGAIHTELCRTAEQCSRKLLSAGRKISAAIGEVPLLESDSPTPFLPPECTVSQSSSTSQATSSTPSSTVYYRILAYDDSVQKVNSAKTSSQTPFAGERPLTFLQALKILNNPGKFLPHLVALHNKGYDIVSGASNTLVLKKVREAVESKEDYFNRPNPIDGTTTPEVSTGNFASPTGFVNHNPVIEPEELEQQQPSSRLSTGKVRREEVVFSGQSHRNWQDGKRMNRKDKRKARRRKTFNRMLMTGTLTAAACYATGVAIEMMHASPGPK